MPASLGTLVVLLVRAACLGVQAALCLVSFHAPMFFRGHFLLTQGSFLLAEWLSAVSHLLVASNRGIRDQLEQQVETDRAAARALLRAERRARNEDRAAARALLRVRERLRDEERERNEQFVEALEWLHGVERRPSIPAPAQAATLPMELPPQHGSLAARAA